MKGKRVTAYEVKAALVASGISNHLFDSGLVYTLQAVHDDYPESHWFSKLREVAKGWGLNTEALDQYGEVQLTDTPDDRWPQSTDALPV